MKLGYCTWGMPTVPVDTQIQHIADLGFDGIELTVIPGYTTDLPTLDSAERQRIKRLLQDHRLELPAIAAHTRLMEPDAEKHAQNMTRLKASVDLAVDWALGDTPPAIDTTFGGGHLSGWEEHKQLIVDRLGELVAHGALRGVVIAIEPHVSDVLDTPAKTLELLEWIDSPYLKVNFDISHFNVIGMPIEESVSALAPVTAHTHVKDETGIAPNYQFLIPGEGDFDYVRYLKAMDAHGYTGFITVEVSVMVQRRPNYDPLAATTQSYQTLSQAFETAGLVRG